MEKGFSITLPYITALGMNFLRISRNALPTDVGGFCGRQFLLYHGALLKCNGFFFCKSKDSRRERRARRTSKKAR